MESDGLNSLRYDVKAFEKLPLYTRIFVHIDEDTVLVRRQFCFFLYVKFLCSFQNAICNIAIAAYIFMIIQVK